MKNAKEWFSIKKLKDKKNKPPKDKAKDPEKDKKDALYENFLKDPKQKKQKNENEYDASKSTQNSDNDSGKNNNANKNKKPKSKNEQQQKKTIEQMIQEDLDEKEFSDLITNIKEKYPNSNTAWVFEAAFYLNNKIPSNVKDVLNVFNSTIVNYPLNIMKDTFKKQLNELFKTFTKQELYQIQLTIIETIIPNIYLTGVSGPVGYLLFLMQLSIYLEQNTVENIDRLASPAVRNKNKEKPNVYLTQIFCLQSIGYYNLKEGLNVWKKLYSPVLDHKYFYQFGLKYLNQILELNKDAYGIIDVKDLIRILKLKAASEHQEILEKILPKLKLLILQNQTDNEIKNSFKELISNLNSFKNENQLEEFIVSCLVYCLDKSRSCFDIWFEYHKTSGSNKDLLLDYLIANPNSIQKETKAYRSTLQKIAKFNDKQGQTNYQSKV